VHRMLRAGILLPIAALVSFALNHYDREAQKLGELMNWRPGEVIAEIGAGEGQMSFAAAERVGRSGRVYATELDASKLAHLRAEVGRRRLQNVSIVQADPIGTNLPDGCCDAIFMRHVYHHFGKPAETDAAILRALTSSGLLAVIDFPPRNGLNGGHGISKKVLVEQLISSGFEVIGESEDWPNHNDYCVIARKAAGTR
jgi:ubiquinone/menaquinone biosynthesis C-methylase UbiE